MTAIEDIESYLIQMGAQYESLGDSMWVVKGQGPDMVVSIAGPVAVFRMKVLERDKVPKGRREELYETLLGLNAGEMLHGAYGIEGSSIVLTSALELENLDFNEFEATVYDLGMAVTKHYPALARLAA